MRRIVSFLLFLLPPLAALGDGMVVPTVAYPAQVTIPDQQALICYSNDTERLVIETRFAGAGTNFAWVVPLPSRPVIEEATTGLFPTLDYLFRPQIISDVPPYYLGILALIWLGYVLLFVRPTGRVNSADISAPLLLIVAIAINVVASVGSKNFDWVGFAGFSAAMLLLYFDLMSVTVLVRYWKRGGLRAGFARIVLVCFLGYQLLCIPALNAASRGKSSTVLPAAVTILNHKLVGIYKTTTLSSHDPKALQTWLSRNGYVVPANSGPIIASYVKRGWVFAAIKVRRDNVAPGTNTPHPLSFTFRSDRPVYPMRLTGLNLNRPLSVALYFFGAERAAARHFKLESCTRTKIVHPLLRQWTAGLPVATKLTATLAPTDMHQDVWLEQTPSPVGQQSRLFSFGGASITALNWGAGFLAVGLFFVCTLALADKAFKTKLPQLVGIVTIVSALFAGARYALLPKTDIKLVKDPFGHSHLQQMALFMDLQYNFDRSDRRNINQARIELQNLLSNPTNAEIFGLKNWNNYYLGGRVREEDSPGNYVLRKTNNQLEFMIFDSQGRDKVLGTFNLPLPR